MRVSKSQARPAFSGSDLLIRFLNFDFNTRSQQELKKDFVISLLLCSISRSNLQSKMKEAGRLQEEIVNDISAFTELALKGDPMSDHWMIQQRMFRRALKTLVDKINRLRIDSQWIVAFGDQEKRLYNGPREETLVFKTVTSQNPLLMGPPRLGPNQRILKVGNVKWIIYRRSYDERSLRKWLYGILISILETGEFGNLRRCPQCRAFFFANDARKKFCGNNCKDDFNNKRRQKEGRFADTRIKSRRRKLIIARNLLKSGKSLYEVVEETELSERILMKAGLPGRSR